jgi:diguanylate cyclase (GGDEF)-like protein
MILESNNKGVRLVSFLALKIVDVAYCREITLAFLCSFALSVSADSFSATIHIENVNKVSVAQQWSFSTGDDMRWAKPSFDDSSWELLPVPGDWRSHGYGDYFGAAWYRLTVNLSDKILDSDERYRLAISVGKVYTSYEIYAGGEILGGVGQLPPNAKVLYDQLATYRIPASAIDEDGNIVIAMRVWRQDMAGENWGGGPYQGDFLFGDYYQIKSDIYSSELILLILAIIYLVIGFYHCYLFIRRQNLTDYLAFGLLAIFTGIYTIFISQWRFEFDLPYIVLKKIEYFTVYLIIPLGIEAAWRAVGVKIGRLLKLYQFSFVCFAIVAVVIPGFTILALTLNTWQIWAMPGLLLTMGFIIYQATKGNSQAKTLLLGATCVLATTIFDMAANIGWIDINVVLSPYGFLAYVMSMMVSLANKVLNFNDVLEIEVAQRTQDLEKATQRLKIIADTDMLTGLLNRQALTEHMLSLADKQIDGCFSVLVLDADHFKRLNDTFGTKFGDFVLIELASILTKNIGAKDFIARWDSQAFVIVLPSMQMAKAEEVAETIRTNVYRFNFELEDSSVNMTITIGVATSRDNEAFDDVLDRAGQALYQGKNSGRNKVVCDK